MADAGARPLPGAGPARAPLVVALGNPLRGDDGAGRAVGEALEEEGLPVLTVHQLGPELADDVARAAAVAFVDAAAEGDPGEVRVRRLRPAAGALASTHALAPEAVLALAERLYGAAPPAVLVTVTGRDFGLREGISAEVTAALPAVAACVRAALALEESG